MLKCALTDFMKNSKENLLTGYTRQQKYKSGNSFLLLFLIYE